MYVPYGRGARCSSTTTTRCALPAGRRRASGCRSIPVGPALTPRMTPPPECPTWSGLDGAEGGPVACGLVWYAHAGKTGGETVERHLRTRAKQYGWQLFDLYLPSSPPDLSRPYRWESTKATAQLLAALNSSRPRVMVTQHSGYGGVGEYYLDRWLRPLACRFRREALENDCRVVLTTTLREPVSRAISHAHQVGSPYDAANTKPFTSFMREVANFQTKFAIFGSDWRGPQLNAGREDFDSTLLPSALSCLRFFDLVGRTEELDLFRDRLDALMGWPALNGTLKRFHDGNRTVFPAKALEVARQYNPVDFKLYNAFCQPYQARRVLSICDADRSHSFPRYYVSEYTRACAQFATPTVQPKAQCKWIIIPRYDGRSCRAGNADLRPNREADVVCEDLRTATRIQQQSSQSTLQPYRRRATAQDPPPASLPPE